MEGSGEIIVDEKLKAIDKRTGRYINVIARTIDNGTSLPIVKYLDKNRKELNYDCVRHLNFDIDIDWELRRYQIVKDLLSNDFDGRRLSVDEVDNAIFTADLIIANTLQEYEGEVTLNQIPENKATEEEISKYGIEVYPTIIVSGDNMDGFNKLEGMARKADLINVMSLYDKK